MPLFGGCLDFETPGFYSEHFNVMRYWVAAPSIGASIPSITFCCCCVLVVEVQALVGRE